MSPTSDKVRPLRYMPVLAVLAFAAAAATQAQKQLFGAQDTIQKAKKSGRFLQRIEDVPIRESILASDNVALAKQRAGSTLELSFGAIPKSPALYSDLSEATGIPATEFLALANSEVPYRSWNRALALEQVARVNAVKIKYRADGISLRNGGERDYPLAEAAAGITGFVKNAEGHTGLELSRNSVLQGKTGVTVGLVDRTGKFLPMRIDSSSSKRVEGREILLTIDSELQIEATRILRRSVESNEATSGVAIVMRPKTGDIVAMANWPSYDPNKVHAAQDDGEVAIGYNPATMAVLEPGSTFKPLTLAKALNDGKVAMGDYVHCAGSLNVWANINLGCDDHGGRGGAHGSVDPTAAIARSCNVSAMVWAKKIGREPFIGFLEDIGLLSNSKLGLPLEARGQINRKEYATGLQLANFGFGQSMTVTPVSLIGAFGTLANGGVRMEPRLIKRVGDVETPIEPGRRVLSKESCDLVLESMRSVFDSDSGTAKSLRIAGYELGGKTGTAQKTNRKTGTMEGGGYVSNFIGFVPARKPEIVILVMIDNPQAGQYYGGLVAGPVFKELVPFAVSRLGLNKTSPTEPFPKTSSNPTRRDETKLRAPKVDVDVVEKEARE